MWGSERRIADESPIGAPLYFIIDLALALKAEAAHRRGANGATAQSHRWPTVKRRETRPYSSCLKLRNALAYIIS